MNPADVQRLLEEQTAAIKLNDERTEQLKKFKADYEALHKRLETLPHKLSHEVMVPFGKLAFMPGKLVHTNEVSVLLGDNWFVDRSAHQACEIIDRRIDVLDIQMDELSQQRGLLAPRKEFTEQLWDVGPDGGGKFEIQEAYDEEKEKEWKEQHRKNVKKYRKEQRAESIDKSTGSNITEMPNVELWNRLDELEDIEKTGRELARLDEPKEVPTEKPVSTNQRPTPQTHLKDTLHNSRQVQEDVDGEEEDIDDNDSDDDSDGDSDTDDGATCIRFSHSTTNAGSKTPPSIDAEGCPIITSPADVYKHFGPRGPRSILRSPGTSPTGTRRHVTITEPPRTEEMQPQPQLTPATSRPKAFSASVIERSSNVEVKPPIAVDTPAPRMSRFKEKRMKQQNR